MTEFVLASTITGGFLVLSNPLAFAALLRLRYPEPAQARQRAANVIDLAARFEARRGVSITTKGRARQELAA